jgi:hypothetical protein
MPKKELRKLKVIGHLNSDVVPRIGSNSDAALAAAHLP